MPEKLARAVSIGVKYPQPGEDDCEADYFTTEVAQGAPEDLLEVAGKTARMRQINELLGIHDSCFNGKYFGTIIEDPNYPATQPYFRDMTPLDLFAEAQIWS